MTRVSKILLLSFSVLLSLTLTCQEEISKEKFIKPDGFLTGFDVSKFLLKALQPERTEYEVSLDFGLNKDFFLVGEGGYTNYKYTGDDYLYNYFSEAYLWRAGFHYNFLKKRDNNDLVTVGILFGHSIFDHWASGLTIIDRRYGESYIDNLTFKNQQANWLEPYFSIKVELFANIFIGWTLRGKMYLGGSDFDVLKPNVLPGFGRFNSNVNAAITYCIFYRIPFHKELH